MSTRRSALFCGLLLCLGLAQLLPTQGRNTLDGLTNSPSDSPIFGKGRSMAAAVSGDATGEASAQTPAQLSLQASKDAYYHQGAPASAPAVWPAQTLKLVSPTMKDNATPAPARERECTRGFANLCDDIAPLVGKIFYLAQWLVGALVAWLLTSALMMWTGILTAFFGAVFALCAIPFNK